MGVLTASAFNTQTDAFAAFYLAMVGTAASGCGFGDATLALSADFGMSKAARSAETALITLGDADLIAALQGAYRTMQGGYVAEIPARLRRPLLKLNSVCAAAGWTGVRDIASFAAYYNTGAGGSWNALCSPAYALAHAGALGAALSPLSVYAPSGVTLGSLAYGGTLVSGTPVDTTKYAGSARSLLAVSSFAGSSSTVTVTGTARLANGTTATGRVFTATVATNGTFALTPSIANDLLISISSITFGGGITAGNFLVSTALPAGRTAPAPPTGS